MTHTDALVLLWEVGILAGAALLSIFWRKP
jgi:hypothetical protein